MCSAFALRPSLHAFACALTRRVYGVGLCMRRMSSAAASDPSHGDRALHEPFAIGGHVNPLPCVLCVGALSCLGTWSRRGLRVARYFKFKFKFKLPLDASPE